MASTTASETIGEILGVSFVFRKWLVFVFAITAITVLILGWVVPRKYDAYATVLIDESTIMQPLLQGTAVATEIADRAKTAKEVLLSRTVLQKLMTLGQWLEADATLAEIEAYAQKRLRRRIDVVSGEGELVRIQFTDENPALAQEVAQFLADTYIAESSRLKSLESETAFDFLDTQVEEYHGKLLDAENKLKDFNTENFDTRAGSQQLVVQKISSLRDELEASEAQMQEAIVKKEKLQAQLAGESIVSESAEKERKLLERLDNFQNELDELRLSYRDNYPDIVQLISRIDDMNMKIAEQRKRRDNVVLGTSPTESRSGTVSSGPENSLYNDMRRDIQDQIAGIAILEARSRRIQSRLDTQLTFGRRLQETDVELAELTRDYEVNQAVYSDLLTRRESARVSMNLDKQQRGSSARIYEPAFFPQRPSGIRFIHFMIGGLVLAVVLPIGLVVVYSQLNSNMRSPQQLVRAFQVPVVVGVPTMLTPKESAGIRRGYIWLTTWVVLVGILYVASGIARINDINPIDWL